MSALVEARTERVGASTFGTRVSDLTAMNCVGTRRNMMMRALDRVRELENS